MNQIKYSRAVTGHGRNGFYIQKGLDAQVVNDVVILSGINSKEMVSVGCLEIPKENFGGVIKMLQKIEKGIQKGDTVAFYLDGNGAHKGEGYVVSPKAHNNQIEVELTQDVKDHKKGEHIFISQNELIG